MFIEQNCTISHEGREFTSGGAMVMPEFVVGYPAIEEGYYGGAFNSWHGQRIGHCRVLSSWRINSWISSRMFSYEILIDGVRYVGRGCGKGMICRGRISPVQPVFGTKENAIHVLAIGLALEIMAYES